MGIAGSFSVAYLCVTMIEQKILNQQLEFSPFACLCTGKDKKKKCCKKYKKGKKHCGRCPKV